MDLTHVTRLVAGAVGEPGNRTFYIQISEGPQLVTLLVEKQQVAALSQLIRQLIARLAAEGRPDAGSGTDTSVPEDMSLAEPLEPAFRVGRMALGYDPDRDLFLLQCEPVDAEEEEELTLSDLEDLDDIATPDDIISDVDPDAVRAWANREQLEELARVGAESVAAGRPICPMCGGSIDPEGHFCPGGNGHKDGIEFG